MTKVRRRTASQDVTPEWLVLQGFTHVCNVGLEAVFQKELPTVQMPVVVTLMLTRGACLSWPPNAVRDHATRQDIRLFLTALSDPDCDQTQPITAEALQALGAVQRELRWCFGETIQMLQLREHQAGVAARWWFTSSEAVVILPRNVYELKLLLDLHLAEKNTSGEKT